MKLPRSVQEIADVIGTDQALYLVGQMPRFKNTTKGGYQCVMYVPTKSRLTQRHELVRILGLIDAGRLCEAFGGEIIQPANCAEICRAHRDRSIILLADEGMPPAQLAELTCVSERHVRKLLREKPQVVHIHANDNTPAREQRQPLPDAIAV
jgi:hypothetical protein